MLMLIMIICQALCYLRYKAIFISFPSSATKQPIPLFFQGGTMLPQYAFIVIFLANVKFYAARTGLNKQLSLVIINEH